MIDLERQKAIGIRQAKKTLANIYKRRKAGEKYPTDQDKITELNRTIARWQSAGPKGWKL
jgi:hypothetical protein